MPAVEFLAAGTACSNFITDPVMVRPGQATPGVEMEMADDHAEAQAAGRLHIIKRPRLTRLLDESEARVIMLVAPPGYGKTTLAREWLEERQFAWYRGTPASADVAALAVGIAQTTGKFIPDAGKRMQDRLRATGTPEQDVQPLAELLAEDLQVWPDDTWLAFDDYQFASESAYAETFVDLLCQLSPIRLLLASRVRPQWATARRLLYGELHELGQNLLAMNGEEALEVLGRGKGTEASGLVALAEGWPAVIGLAALADDFEPPDGNGGLPDTLYDYLADELYQEAAPELQRGICRLALAPSLTTELVVSLLGDRAPWVTEEGLRLGFLTSPAKGYFDIHPLFRAFLDVKLRQYEPTEIADLTSDLGRLLIEHDEWDDAFTLIKRFFTEKLYERLLEDALPSLLHEGRLPTLIRWVELGTKHRIDLPVLDLAQAEIAFRKADRSKAEALSLRAAKQLGPTHPLTSRAYWLAGTSTQLSDRNQESFEHFSLALETAQSSSERWIAASGRAATASKLEREDVEALVSELAALNDNRPESEIRLLIVRMVSHARMGIGHWSSLLTDYEAAMHLLPSVRDPLSRTSFLYAYGQALCRTGRYMEAFALAEQMILEARRTRLDFVLPYAYRLKAIAEIGAREFKHASVSVGRLERAGLELDDTYLSIEAQILKTRLLLAQRLFERAVLPEHLHRQPPSPSEEGEFLAWQGVVHVCLGRHEGLGLATRAEQLTRSSEVRTVVAFARAIAMLNSADEDAETFTYTTFERVLKSGHVDPFVSTYRAYPRLLEVLSRKSEWREPLASIIEQALDTALVRELDLPLNVRQSQRRDLLSRREREVHVLLAQGLSNKEIARQLYISDSTVKVHVRHIFEKLGVRTRVEAALREVAQESDQATSANSLSE